jgi:hypothetical protein
MNVSLVLSMEARLVSHQYYAKHDDFFEKVSPEAFNPDNVSNWQKISVFKVGIKTGVPRGGG